MPNGPTYVIITPARDEEAYIEKTLQSVINQTMRPAEWAIVDDGYTDRTGDNLLRAICFLDVPLAKMLHCKT